MDGLPLYKQIPHLHMPASNSKRESPLESQFLDQRVQWQTSLIAGGVLAILLWLADWAKLRLWGSESAFSRGVMVGLNLLLIWLIATGTVRTMHRLRPRISLARLYAGGTVAALLGVMLKALYQAVAGRAQGVEYQFKSLLFHLGIAAVASSIAVIRLRVRNRRLGQVLEIGLIAGLAALFLVWMK